MLKLDILQLIQKYPDVFDFVRNLPNSNLMNLSEIELYMIRLIRKKELSQGLKNEKS